MEQYKYIEMVFGTYGTLKYLPVVSASQCFYYNVETWLPDWEDSVKHWAENESIYGGKKLICQL